MKHLTQRPVQSSIKINVVHFSITPFEQKLRRLNDLAIEQDLITRILSIKL